MGSKLETAALVLGISLLASPAVAGDKPSGNGATVDILSNIGVMSPDKKGEKELEDMLLYRQMAAEILLPFLELPSICPGIKDGVAVKPGVATPKWGREIPVETQILTHYADLTKSVITGHTASAFLGSPEANYVFDVSKPGTEACLDAGLDRVNTTVKSQTSLPITCNLHADLVVTEPRSVAVFGSCGPRSLPNNPTADPHYNHQAGTTPKAR